MSALRIGGISSGPTKSSSSEAPSIGPKMAERLGELGILAVRSDLIGSPSGIDFRGASPKAG